MRTLCLIVAVAAMAATLAPSTSAQAHQHGTGPVRIATDLNDAGLALVGHPAHFALVAFGDDEVPDFHQDLPVRVWFNNVLMWEQTALSGHDYDGINAFSIAFPAPGVWRIEALDGETVIAQRNGTVVPVGGPSQLSLQMDSDGAQRTFTYQITQNNTIVPHSDGWFEVWRDGMLWFRTHTHTHQEPQQVTLRLPGGDYVARVTGYIAFPTGSGARFSPIVSELPFTVAPSPPGLPDPAAPTPPADRNAAVTGSGTPPYRLVGTYDPFTSVGMDTLQHLSGVVVDEHGGAVQHVDFEATLRGPGGILFASDTLHEYDGIYDLATRQAQPGTYWLDLTATRGDWSDTIQLPYTVLPPVVPSPSGPAVAGPQIVTLAAAMTAGQASAMQLRIENPAGVPFAHGEVEMQVRGASSQPAIVHAKLHTHANGDFPFRLALPAGDHELLLTPFPLDPQPVLGYSKDQLGNPLDFPLDVADGPGFPAAPPVTTPAPDDAEAGAAALWLVPLLGALAICRRR